MEYNFFPNFNKLVSCISLAVDMANVQFQKYWLKMCNRIFTVKLFDNTGKSYLWILSSVSSNYKLNVQTKLSLLIMCIKMFERNLFLLVKVSGNGIWIKQINFTGMSSFILRILGNFLSLVFQRILFILQIPFFVRTFSQLWICYFLKTLFDFFICYYFWHFENIRLTDTFSNCEIKYCRQDKWIQHQKVFVFNNFPKIYQKLSTFQFLHL